MRRPRLKAPDHLPVAYYHCVSRVVNRDFVLGPAEKERFLSLMRLYEAFGGLRVVALCVMSNHFHVLVEVPKRPADAELPDDAGLVAHVRGTLGGKVADGLEWELKHLREAGAGAAADALRERWLARMWDVSAFMKTVKQRFTQWFNRRHRRRGTLWEERFRSVLVEGKGPALRAMAAYIELNPVRAGICEDPKDYRWSSHGEAVSGGRRGRSAREILRWLVSDDRGMRAAPPSASGPATARAARAAPTDRPWPSGEEALSRWRCVLFGLPAGERGRAEELAKDPEAARVGRRGLSREKALEVLASGGRLAAPDYLRCRVRYFSDGVALGTRDFVEGIFAACRGRFPPGRKKGAHRLRGLEAGEKPERLYNLRQLRKDVFG